MKSVKEHLLESEALLHGHFKLSSGKHSDAYVQCAKLLQYPDRAEEVAKVIVDKLKEAGQEVDLVCGPAMGGIVIAYELGRQLGVPAIFTERENDVMTLRRGFEVHEGQKVLVSEDVITTGKSSLETIKVLKEGGAEVVGLACLANRSGKDHLEEYPIYDAISLDIQIFDPEDCPLCKKGEKLVKPGSRKKFD